jgi:hypothetical protein
VHNVGEGCSFKVPGSQETGNAAEKQEIGEGAKRHPLAFTPPEFDLGISQSNPAGGSDAPTCSLDEISEATFKRLEDESMDITSRKRKAHVEEPSSAKNSVTPAYQPAPK